MTAQELIAQNNLASIETLFKFARKVPVDKLEWKPLDSGRTVLDLCQECALSPTWPLSLMNPDKPFEMTQEVMDAFMKAKAQLTDLDKCEVLAKENVTKLNEFVLACSDERLSENVPMPMRPSGEMPVVEALQLHHWNSSYHAGQVCYIQTLYGDHSM